MIGQPTTAVAGRARGPRIDRVRCKIDPRTDALGNPQNHLQISVKVRSARPADVWVTSRGATSQIQVGEAPVDGVVRVEWDSSIDPGDIIDNATLPIDPAFVEIGGIIMANAYGVAPVKAKCREKASRMFRQDTKPLRVR